MAIGADDGPSLRRSNRERKASHECSSDEGDGGDGVSLHSNNRPHLLTTTGRCDGRYSRRVILLLLPIYLVALLLGPCLVRGTRDTWMVTGVESTASGPGSVRGGTRSDSFEESVSASLIGKVEGIAVVGNAGNAGAGRRRGGGQGGGGGGRGGGREIIITSDMQVLEEFKVSDKLTIRGHAKHCRDQRCSISANAVARMFHVYEGGSLTLINLSVTRGFSHMNGGAIYVEAGGKLNATSVLFSRNSVWDGSGGAVFMGAGANASFTDCVFFSNSAQHGYGAAVFVGRTAIASLRGCAFDKNIAKSSRRQDIYAARGGSAIVEFCSADKPMTAGVGSIKLAETRQEMCVKRRQPIRPVSKIDNMVHAGQAR